MKSIINTSTEIIFEYDNNNYIEYYEAQKLYKIYVNKGDGDIIMTTYNYNLSFVIFGLLQDGISSKKIEAILLLIKK